jgi:hypothetical protein
MNAVRFFETSTENYSTTGCNNPEDMVPQKSRDGKLKPLIFMFLRICVFAIITFLILRSPGIDEIPAELIKARGRTIRCEIHKLIIPIWNKEELPEEWKESIIVPL